jgi:hypothetical protein
MDAVRAESLFGSSSADGRSEEGSGEEAMDEDDEGSQYSKAPSHQSSHRSVSSHVFSLAERIHRKLCVGDSELLPVKSHRSAVNSMMELRDVLISRRIDSEPEVRMLLLYAGISVQRRMALGAEGEEGSDLQVSMALLLMLQILCDQQARHPTPSPTQTGGRTPPPPVSPSLLANPLGPREEGMDAAGQAEEESVLGAPQPDSRQGEEILSKWHSTSLKEVMRSVEGEEDDAWAAVLRITPASVCRACVAEAPKLGASSLGRLSQLAHTFFRCSAFTLQYSMLESQQPKDDSSRSFLTLGMADVMMAANDDLREAKLQAIVDSAESEAGQQVLRDIILSFTLPQGVVGVRRTPLLGREANRIATEQHTEILGAAHECAMRGAEWTWKEDKEEIHKMSALLAGLCIQMAGRGGTADAIRKSDAFQGRVQLPFLETDPPAAGVSRLGFVPHNNEWVVYSIDRKGKPCVKLKHQGFEGLCLAALAVIAK